MDWEAYMDHINFRKAEKGQSLVEFSLGMVFILLIVCGLLDLGRLYFTHVALEDAAGEGALYLSLNPHCVHASDGTDCTDPNNVDWRIRNSSDTGAVDWSKANITYNVPAPYAVGETVKVNINYSYQLITPVIPKITGVNPITLGSSASQIIITELSGT
jgi:Flp pilus assembly protein TadG